MNFEQMHAAMGSLPGKILRLQRNGDYVAVQAFVEQYGQVGE